MFLLLSTSMVKGQAALLVLIFGDKAATENFHFSLKLGMNYAIIHGIEDGDYATSLNFGLVNNIRLSDRLSLVPEFIPLAPRQMKNVPVVTTGNPDLDDLLVEVESADRRLNYIDIPVLLKVKLNDRFSASAAKIYRWAWRFHCTPPQTACETSWLTSASAAGPRPIIC